jgi:hypothetical protein
MYAEHIVAEHILRTSIPIRIRRQIIEFGQTGRVFLAIKRGELIQAVLLSGWVSSAVKHGRLLEVWIEQRAFIGIISGKHRAR